MSKGNQTRSSILSDAVELASVVGLEGLTIGALAEQTAMSKSGLFAHFGSKEQLQLATLEAGIARFTEVVIRPALKAERGLTRIRTLFDGWLAWSCHTGPRGGCLFAAATFEQDDREGPVRDYLVEQQTAWIELMADMTRRTMDLGQFRADLDPYQFAHELNGIFLTYQQARRLLRDPQAEVRARASFARLCKDATDGTALS